MEIKKSKKAELESWRSIFFLIGAVITLSLLLAAFEWKSPPPKTTEITNGTLYLGEDLIINTVRKKTKAKKPVVMIIDKFRTIDNDKSNLKNEIMVPDGWDEGMTMDSMELEDETLGAERFYPFPQYPPKFPGDINEYLQKNVHYPVEAREIGSEGTVYLKFEISSTGKVRKVEIQRGVDNLLDQEAIRVIESMPKWTPAMQGDKKVATSTGISIKFTLRN